MIQINEKLPAREALDLNSRSTFPGQHSTGTGSAPVVNQTVTIGTKRAKVFSSEWASVRVIELNRRGFRKRDGTDRRWAMHVFVTTVLATFALISVVAISAQVWEDINSDHHK
jgi:hypothetical protein